MTNILISTGSLAPRGLDDIASIARQAGADGLELLLNGRLLTAGPERVARIAHAHDVPIRSIHPPIRLFHSAGYVHDDLIAAAEFARELPDCQILVMHAVGGPTLHSEDGRAFFRTVEAVTTILRKSGIRLAIENRGTVQPQPRMDFLDRLQNLYRVCEEWDLDITFDTSHAASFGLNIVPALDVVYPRLANVHLSDRREEAPAIASGMINSLTREHQIPGDGTATPRTLRAAVTNQGVWRSDHARTVATCTRHLARQSCPRPLDTGGAVHPRTTFARLTGYRRSVTAHLPCTCSRGE